MSAASESAKPAARRRLVVLLPLAIFLALAGLFLFRLGSGDPSRLPSVCLFHSFGRSGWPAIQLLMPVLWIAL